MFCRMPRCVVLLGCLTWPGCTAQPQDAELAHRPATDVPETDLKAPERFGVRLDTSKGVIRLDIHRDWAPHGADRFYRLARAGYFDQAKFFRVIRGKWAQFGINGDPNISKIWRERTIPDDPPRESNVRGTIAFAFAVPNGRTTQLFINLRDNSATHDPEPFVPIGRVVEGMRLPTRSTPTTANHPAAEFAQTSSSLCSRRATPIWIATFRASISFARRLSSVRSREAMTGYRLEGRQR